MDNLLYLSYGGSSYADELIYSVLSALHKMGHERNGYRVIVYTDDPPAFGDLPVHIEPIDGQLLAEWAGPFDFNHRRKIFAVRDALQKFGGRLAYCDTDTYFFRHPRKLFARIRPGHTVMHISEYHLSDRPAHQLAASLEGHDFHSRTGHRWNITPATVMYNAGVIGLHESEISLLDEVVHLTDQIYPYVKIPTIEQFAFSVCFRHYTKLRQSYDIIHHYWPPASRALFREKLSQVLHNGSIPSYEDRFPQLLPDRPSLKVCPLQWGRQSLSQRLGVRLRFLLSRAAERAGLKDQLKQVAKWAGMSN